MNKKKLIPWGWAALGLAAAAVVAPFTYRGAPQKKQISLAPLSPVYSNPVSYADETTHFFRLGDGSQHIMIFEPIGQTMQHGKVVDPRPSKVYSDNNGDGLIDTLSVSGAEYALTLPSLRTNELYGHTELIARAARAPGKSMQLTRTNDYLFYPDLFNRADLHIRECINKAK